MADNTVEIIIKAAVEKAGEKVRSFTQKATQQFKRMGDFVRNLGKKLFNLKSIAIGALAGWGIKRVVGEFERLSGVQEQAEATLKQAMVSMERYSEGAFEAMKEHASALQKVTTFGDEATLAGMKFLMTYKDITDDLMPRATKTMLDLAALMGGDTRQAANMLGKASMGLAGELRRVGITIDEDVAKAGDFAAILSEIEKQVGGQAEALATTDAGKIQQFGNVWGDVKEKIGAAIAKIHAAISERLKPLFESADQWLGNFLDSGQWEQWANSISEWVSGKAAAAFELIVEKGREAYEWVSENGPKVKEFFDSMAESAKGALPFLGNLWKVIKFAYDWTEKLFLAAGKFWGNIAGAIYVATENIIHDVKRIISWFARLKDGISAKIKAVVEFLGFGSTVKPLTEKIREMQGKMEAFTANVNALKPTIKLDASQVTQAAGGPSNMVGGHANLGTTVLTGFAAKWMQAHYVQGRSRTGLGAPAGPVIAGSMGPGTTPFIFKPMITQTFGFPPTREQAKQAALQLSGALAEEIKYGRGELAGALKELG